MAFGDRLQEIRRRNGLTQEQFAEALNVSRQAVSKWESSRGYPEIEKILYICNRYQVRPDELFADEVMLHAAAPRNDPPPEGNLHSALSGFCSNLSPKNKWLGLGVLAGVGFLSVLIALCLKGGTTNMEAIIWIAAIILFGVMEGLTAGLTSIWFVLGGVAGLIADVCGAPIWLQVVLFFVVSIVSLIATRPLVRKFAAKNTVATNADRVLGATARVTEEIDNTVPAGAVYVDGKTWSARSETGALIPVDAMVRVKRMEGVRLFVEEAE
ncbi:MAG: helix-turn-helix domain-containing protein [Oscillospiraceae bacterium]|nr:helix-turn-helix domain-containing protein [Oscillospiraceae bacterium]